MLGTLIGLMFGLSTHSGKIKLLNEVKSSQIALSQKVDSLNYRWPPKISQGDSLKPKTIDRCVGTDNLISSEASNISNINAVTGLNQHYHFQSIIIWLFGLFFARESGYAE